MDQIRIARRIANVENTSVRVHDTYTDDLLGMMNMTIKQIHTALQEGMIPIESEEHFSGFQVIETPPLQEQTTLYLFTQNDRPVGMIGTRPCPQVPNAIQMVSAGVDTQMQNRGIGTTMGAFILQKAQMAGKNLAMEDDITSDSMRRIKKQIQTGLPVEAYDTSTKTFHPVIVDENGEITCDVPGLFNTVPGKVDMQKQFAPKVPEKIKLVLRAQ